MGIHILKRPLPWASLVDSTSFWRNLVDRNSVVIVKLMEKVEKKNHMTPL
jgi:hypothetical protein